MSEDLGKLSTVIKKSQSFMLTTHINPEGDAIGSELALALALENMGKNVTVVNQDPVPYSLTFLPGVWKVRHVEPGNHFDVGILLDCGSPERTGSVGELLPRCDTIISIDHHVTYGGYGDYCLHDSQASSTGELVFQLLKHLERDIDEEIATLLWVAVMTDTGSFRYSNTSSAALQIAAELVDLGARPWEISEKLYEREPHGKLLLLSKVLSTLEVSDCGEIASITVFKRDMDTVGATNDYLEGFINYPRSIEGVKVAVSFREETHRFYKVSLRAKGDADVARVATSFSGGGHVKAAGFKAKGNLTKVKRDVYRKINEMLKECSSDE